MSPRPTPPADLAGRSLTKFFTDHLAGERAASARTIASYRDAMKLLLTWFKNAEHIPPEQLRLADIDRSRVLRFLGWLETERGCSPATRNQRLAVIKWFCRYTAVEQPAHLDHIAQVLGIRQKNTPAPDLGHLTGDEIKALLGEPGTATTRAVGTPSCSPWPTTPEPASKSSATSTSPTSAAPHRSSSSIRGKGSRSATSPSWTPPPASSPTT